PWQRNMVCFVKGSGTGAVGGTLAFDIQEADPQLVPLGSLTKNSNGSYAGDCTGLWTGDSGMVKLSRRTVTSQWPTGLLPLSGPVFTVVDEVECDGSLTPHICWNTPNQPQIFGYRASGLPILNARSMTFANGAAAATLTFDSPKTAIAIGGVDHMIDGLDGKPYLPDVSRELNASMMAQPDDGQIRWGGYWRVHVVLPPGGGKLTTTIQVR
ncbi:MAG TPA: hypothetical protein VKU82_02485, partial [Planctomycetaceae bacterium]|nr:hypothetical protein [Planctomycetaceae bacterium]